MSFANLETRSNAAVMRRLSNAVAVRFRDLKEIPVIFDRAFTETSTGATATTPVATAADADLVDLVPHTDQITINETLFNVRDVQRDGTGLSVLILEAAE